MQAKALLLSSACGACAIVGAVTTVLALIFVPALILDGQPLAAFIPLIIALLGGVLFSCARSCGRRAPGLATVTLTILGILYLALTPEDATDVEISVPWNHTRAITATEFLRLRHVPALPSGVPKVLHQTWKSRELLVEHARYFSSWDRCLEHEWIHVLWTDQEVEAFVNERAPRFFLPTYRSYVHAVQRVDTFRYVLLGALGGVYADLDNECFESPQFNHRCTALLGEQACHNTALWQCGEEQKAQYESDVVAYEAAHGVHIDSGASAEPKPVHFNSKTHVRGMPPPVQNSLLASAPGHPYWNFLLELCVERGRAGALQNVRATTGVDLIALANYAWNAKEPAKENATCVLEKEDWHGDPIDVDAGVAPHPKYVLHHGTSSWRTGWAFVAEGCKTVGPALGDPICYVLFRYFHFVSKPYYLIGVGWGAAFAAVLVASVYTQCRQRASATHAPLSKDEDVDLSLCDASIPISNAAHESLYGSPTYGDQTYGHGARQ